MWRRHALQFFEQFLLNFLQLQALPLLQFLQHLWCFLGALAISIEPSSLVRVSVLLLPITGMLTFTPALAPIARAATQNNANNFFIIKLVCSM